MPPVRELWAAGLVAAQVALQKHWRGRLRASTWSKCECGEGGRWHVNLDRLPDLVPSLAYPASSSSRDEVEKQAAWQSPWEHQLWDALGPVANVYRSLMAKISPETLPKTLVGLNVLVLHDRNERKRVSKDEMAPPEMNSSEFGRADILLESLRYMRMSTAAYGRVTLRPGPGVAVTEQNFVQLLCKHTGASLNPEKVMVPHASLRAGWLLPAHYVLLDRERREAVVTVRGTLSVPDVLTDLGAEEVDLFLGGKAHKNMLQSACNVLRVIGPVLRDLSGEVDTVTFAGHSLGGGVAAYLTMLFLEIVEGHALPVTILPADFECQADTRSGDADAQKKYSCRLRVRCFSFGAPGICSAAVSESLQDRVASFCHAEDVVPRLSTGHLLELHGRAVLAASGAGDLVKRLLERAQAGRDSGGLLKAAQAAAEAIPEGFEKALQMSTAEAMGSTCSKSMESIDMLKLYPAGRCFLLQTDGEVEELEPEALAPRIDLSGGHRMVIDHMPRVYEAVMKAAADKARNPDVAATSRL